MTTGVHDRINIKGTIENWAKYTVADWRKAVVKAKIGQSGEFNRSFRYQLFFHGHELIRIQFQFRHYAKFVDMGVGKGVKINDVGELKIARGLRERNTNRRRPKRWLNKSFTYNHNRLAEIMATLYGRSVRAYIVESISV